MLEVYARQRSGKLLSEMRQAKEPFGDALHVMLQEAANRTRQPREMSAGQGAQTPRLELYPNCEPSRLFRYGGVACDQWSAEGWFETFPVPEAARNSIGCEQAGSIRRSVKPRLRSGEMKRVTPESQVFSDWQIETCVDSTTRVQSVSYRRKLLMANDKRFKCSDIICMGTVRSCNSSTCAGNAVVWIQFSSARVNITF